MNSTTCEMCDNKAIKEERYCKACKKIKLAEMKESGYLASRPTGHIGQGRTSDMKEVQRETKSGTWHG